MDCKRYVKRVWKIRFHPLLSQNDFLQVGAGVLEGYSGDCSKPEPGVDAAAAVEGTCGRVRSGIPEAPGKVQSGKSNIQFFC